MILWGFIPDTPWPTSNVIKKVSFVLFLKMRPYDLFQPFLLNGCHGNHDRYEIFVANILKLLKGAKFDYDQTEEENVITN